MDVTILAIVLVVLLLFGLTLRYMRIKIARLRIALQQEHNELVEARISTNLIQSQHCKQVYDLRDALKKKSHTEQELNVMRQAMHELSRARSDELHEVLIASRYVKVDRLLGKGGFGVVNLAKYNGQKVAMKQLITINDENVSRFRHECFLMKTLRHPNIVKLVGVCWEDSMFACCLEFVENGTVEDWLKKTAGGDKASVENDKYKKQCEETYLGWGDSDEYDASVFNAKDKGFIEQHLSTIEFYEAECLGSELATSAWEPCRQEDGSGFEQGARGWWRVHAGWAETFSVIEIDAKPSQAMDANISLNDANQVLAEVDFERIESSYMHRVKWSNTPFPPPLSARELLLRQLYQKRSGGSFMSAGYTVDDERKPLAKGGVKLNTEVGTFMRAKEGSNGEICEVLRFVRVRPNFGLVLGVILNAVFAKKSANYSVLPLIVMKNQTERRLRDYAPTLPGGRLTWKVRQANARVSQPLTHLPLCHSL